MIHDEICTYEVCKLAKEKGFPQHPNENDNCQIYCWDNLRKIHSLCISEMYYIGEYSRGDMYAAPTQSLLQRWLRKEKAVHIQVILWNKGFFAQVTKYEYHEEEKEYNPRISFQSRSVDIYELALEDALKYALENLI